MTVDDFKANAPSAKFDELMKGVSTSCKALGHSPEAAKFARRCCFALVDYFGLNSLFLTITPCDECSFRVRLYAYSNQWHKLPDLMMDEERCVADFKLRQKTRLTYPGACSLEYQNIKKIVIETLLQWDCNKQKPKGKGVAGTVRAFAPGDEEQSRGTLHGHWQIFIEELTNEIVIETLLQWDCIKQKPKGKGVLGTLRAFAPGDEEQSRGTLHSHWQIFIEELTNEVRSALFEGNEADRTKAKQKIIDHIDKVMNSSYGGDIYVVHKCNQSEGTACRVGEIFQQCSLQTLRNARHKNLCNDVRGNILECKDCKELFSTTDIVNLALKRWRDSGPKHIKSRLDTVLPISGERLDIAAYTYSYHMEGGCHPIKDEFWSNKDLRTMLLKHRFEEHAWSHRRSCFKKGCECRGYFP
ncbi:hypothetical protein ACHAXR_001615, partial [Thalassiosira sp. AJA248-18]